MGSDARLAVENLHDSVVVIVTPVYILQGTSGNGFCLLEVDGTVNIRKSEVDLVLDVVLAQNVVVFSISLAVVAVLDVQVSHVHHGAVVHVVQVGKLGQEAIQEAFIVLHVVVLPGGQSGISQVHELVKQAKQIGIHLTIDLAPGW